MSLPQWPQREGTVVDSCESALTSGCVDAWMMAVATSQSLNRWSSSANHKSEK